MGDNLQQIQYGCYFSGLCFGLYEDIKYLYSLRVLQKVKMFFLVFLSVLRCCVPPEGLEPPPNVDYSSSTEVQLCCHWSCSQPLIDPG